MAEEAPLGVEGETDGRAVLQNVYSLAKSQDFDGDGRREEHGDNAGLNLVKQSPFIQCPRMHLQCPKSIYCDKPPRHVAKCNRARAPLLGAPLKVEPVAEPPATTIAMDPNAVVCTRHPMCNKLAGHRGNCKIRHDLENFSVEGVDSRERWAPNRLNGGGMKRKRIMDDCRPARRQALTDADLSHYGCSVLSPRVAGADILLQLAGECSWS